MRIKKIDNNEYISAGGIWVRNFTKQSPPMNISAMVDVKDHHILLANEQKNRQQGYGNIAEEKLALENVIIVSNGYDVQKRQEFISKLPTNVFVFGVNRILHKWQLLDPNVQSKRAINLYVANNPYAECLTYLHPKYYPSCVASIRTNAEFISRYKGRLYFYEPTPDVQFGFDTRQAYCIDDYRNPVCAAIDLAFRCGAKRIMLLCCDSSFEGSRDAAVELENGLYTYPQHIRLQDIIDAKMFWLTRYKDRIIKVCDYSSGRKYANIPYINTDEQAVDFFVREDDEGEQ
jgi:hypothetical protein